MRNVGKANEMAFSFYIYALYHTFRLSREGGARSEWTLYSSDIVCYRFLRDKDGVDSQWKWSMSGTTRFERWRSHGTKEGGFAAIKMEIHVYNFFFFRRIPCMHVHEHCHLRARRSVQGWCSRNLPIVRTLPRVYADRTDSITASRRTCVSRRRHYVVNLNAPCQTSRR